MKSKLIDELIPEAQKAPIQRFYGMWWKAKPEPDPWYKRIGCAFRVLAGKSFAVHYKIDEIKKVTAE